MVISIIFNKTVRLKHDIFSIYVHPFEMFSETPPIVDELDDKTNFTFKYNIKRWLLQLGS